MTNTAEIKKVRASTSGVTLTMLGMTSLQVDLVPLRRGERVAPKLVCPECAEATKLSQRYVCPNHEDHGPYAQQEVQRAIDVDGILRKVTDDEIAALKDPTIEPKQATFRIFPADQVESETMPAGTAYRLRPKNAPQVYAMLVDVVRERGDLAFVAELNARSQKMYRLAVRDRALVAMELIRPGEFNPDEEMPTEYNGELLDAALTLVDQQVEDFDPESWTDFYRARAKELQEAKLTNPNEPAPIRKVEKVDSADALLEALTAAAGKKPRKAAAKKAPAKRASKKAAAKK